MATTETRYIMAKVFEVTAGMSEPGKEQFYQELIWELQTDANRIRAAKWVKEGHNFRAGMDNDG